MIDSIPEFYEKISQDDPFSHEIISLERQTLSVQSINSDWIIFQDCIFNCALLEFKNINNKNLIIEFRNCTFNCKVIFSNSIFEKLKFKNTKSIISLDLHKGPLESNTFQLRYFDFFNSNNEKLELNTHFKIRNTNIDNFYFRNIKHVQGTFKFIGNTAGENDGQSSFQNSTISNVFFGKNKFYNYTSFKKASFNYTTEYVKPIGATSRFPGFYKNEFGKISFSESNFISTFQFENCDFLDTTWFEECKNLGNSELKFVSCKFDKYSLFDSSKFNKIEISHSKFLEKASFENFETNSFKIHQVTFAGSAYFDDLNKDNNLVIEKWDRKTVRAIKRELVNTHNQIDYLRFKAYELNAYKKEKGKNWKDRFILYLNEKSNYFGLDWTKGFLFTSITGFLFYLLYLCTYAIVMKNTLYFPRTIEDFFVGYLKFLNPFSLFKSPIENAETYFFPLLFFMIGKIFISYGIVQTVQAFRKFGVNGG